MLHDAPTVIALLGTFAFTVWVAAALRYAATHYTRLPGGDWTTWGKTVTSAPPGVREVEERAA